MTGPREAAHAYLDRGFLPVGWVIHRGTKVSVTMKGRHYADLTVTHADIDAWPRCQVGLAMCQRSGYWALDFDCGQDRVNHFFAAHSVSRTAAQTTGRGLHLVYRGTGETPWPRDGGWSADWPDVQVRSNGFIAAWPSVHPNGRQYTWTDGTAPRQPGTMLLGFRPDREPTYRARRGEQRDDGLDAELAHYAVHGIPFGWQDTELYRLACKHVRSMDRAELAGQLWAAASRSVQNPHSPWRPEDIADKITRAAQFTAGEDRQNQRAVASFRESNR